MIAHYIVGLLVSKGGLTEHQQKTLNQMLREWVRGSRHVTLMVPSFCVEQPWERLPLDFKDWLLRARDNGELSVDVGSFSHGPETPGVMSWLGACDELVGFPARGRMRHKPDRVWSVYHLVNPPASSKWRQGMKIVQPWVSSTFGAEVKAGKK